MNAASRLRLYSYWRSSASYRVRIALELKGLSYEYLPVHLIRDSGEQHQSTYRAINPQGRVPSLEVEGHILTQSLAILEYLEESRPQPPLLPANDLARARVRSLANLVACDIQPLQNLGVTQYLKTEFGLGDVAVKTWLHEWIGRGLAAVETRLARDGETGRFCHGDLPTLADVCLVPQCYAAVRFGMDLARYPAIARIHGCCLELDAFRRAAPEAQPDAQT